MQLGSRRLDIQPLYIEPDSPWENGTVTYRSRMHTRTKRYFKISSAEDFTAAITAHIPEKGFQMMRSYDWYKATEPGASASKTQAEQPEAGLWWAARTGPGGENPLISDRAPSIFLAPQL